MFNYFVYHYLFSLFLTVFNLHKLKILYRLTILQIKATPNFNTAMHFHPCYFPLLLCHRNIWRHYALYMRSNKKASKHSLIYYFLLLQGVFNVWRHELFTVWSNKNLRLFCDSIKLIKCTLDVECFHLTGKINLELFYSDNRFL